MPKEPVIKEVQLDDIISKFVFIAIILAVVLGAASAQTASTPSFKAQTVMTSGSPGNIRAGHILVRFKGTPAQDVLNRLNTAFGAKLVGTIAGIGVRHLQVAGSGVALLDHLRQRPDVEFAEFDSHVQAFVTPNDPYFSTAYPTFKYGSIAQWAPQAVSAPSAWAATDGSQSVVIAIVDTGVDDTHPDLASKIVGEYNFVKGESVHDGFGHGTHVAGIAAAATDNSTGVAGICWNCGILSVKVLDSQGSGYISDVASGITYAASHGARVISMSLGGSGHTQTLDNALNYAVANNALPVCAMGNSGSGSNTPEPAYWYPCLTVVATDQSGARASFSNYGAKADVAAPGVGVLSTMPTYSVTLNSYGYKQNYDALSGTSMATPVVSGIAGLVLSVNPNLTPAQVKGIIMASAGDGSTWTPDLAFGLVNAATAVSKASNSLSGVPSPNLISPMEGATVSGLVTVQAAPTDSTAAVHHIDLVQNDTRFLQPLIGVSATNCTSKKSCTSAPAWMLYWPSTLQFNSGSVSLSVIASDVFGNSGLQTRSFSLQNRLVSQSWTQSLCLSATSTCPSSVWFPVTTGVATQAAVHLQGTISYSAPKKSPYPNFGLNVFGTSSSGSFQFSCRVFNGATVDCYPPDPFDLYPDTKGGYSNYSGAELEPTSPTTGTVQWTLTYPQ